MELKLQNSNKTVTIDDEDFDKVKNIKWYVSVLKNGQYIIYGYFGNQKKKYLWRYLLNVTNPKIQIDHKDNDRFNNKKENLRICNNQQNACNQNKRQDRKYTSKYKGVAWRSRYQKWVATIFFNYKQKYIGLFPTEELAAMAYDKKAIELHKEFAKLNFPEKDYTNYDDGIIHGQSNWVNFKKNN